MANKKEETKKTSSKKTNTTKKSTAKKTNNNGVKKTSTSKKTTTKSTPKKTTPKKVEKELEKTVIIEDIENKINDIVENKVIESKQNIAKLENAKYTIRKRNKQLLAIGVLISLLGIIALIITLIANRIVDKQFISDNAIVMMVIASILIEIFGAFIIINES